MKYKVKIEQLETVEGEPTHYTGRDLYEQIVEDLDVWSVILAVNKKEKP